MVRDSPPPPPISLRGAKADLGHRVVDNRPRMALFAGDDGIETGEELTYDYNFK